MSKTYYTVTTVSTRRDGWSEEYDVSLVDSNGNLGERALANRIEAIHGWRPESITRIQRAVVEPSDRGYGFVITGKSNG